MLLNPAAAAYTFASAVFIEELDEVVGFVQVHDPASTAGKVVLKEGIPPALVTNTALLTAVISPITLLLEE